MSGVAGLKGLIVVINQRLDSYGEDLGLEELEAHEGSLEVVPESCLRLLVRKLGELSEIRDMRTVVFDLDLRVLPLEVQSECAAPCNPGCLTQIDLGRSFLQLTV